MNCGNCACALSENKMTFEVQSADGKTLKMLCADCFDSKNKHDILIAVWKFGTSVEVDDEDEFDVNDYKDYMFASGDDEGSDCESECDEEEECYGCGSFTCSRREHPDDLRLCESCCPKDDDDEEEDKCEICNKDNDDCECDVCYGKYCSKKTGLSRRLGLKRQSEEVFSEELYCDECAVYCCFADCKSCSNEFPMTELRYVSGGIFRDSAYVYNQLRCVPCIESVIDYCDRTGYMAGDFN